jgi:cytoskeletal protein RodZ
MALVRHGITNGMDELGHILREARETKGYTLAEVQQETRISTRFLEALEDGEYDRLPTAVHVRGFLRNYARFLGLDPEPLLNRYLINQNNRPHPIAIRRDPGLPTTPPLPLPQDREQPFFDPVNMQVNSGYQRGDSESGLRLVIILALIITIALVASKLITLVGDNQDSNTDLLDGITTTVQELINNEAATEPELQPTPDGLVENEINTSTGRNEGSDAFSTPAPTRPPLPATMETIRLHLDITERTWMEVLIDGDVVFSGIARQGDPPYEWEAQEEATVNTGNAIGVYVTINDVELGRLGGRGENKEETWRTTSQ